jgi:hypothetical protein
MAAKKAINQTPEAKKVPAKKAPAKKAAAKKTPAKKEPKKKQPTKKELAQLAIQKKDSVLFNVLEGGLERSRGVGEAMKKTLEARKGRIVDFTPQSELLIETLPLRKADHIELQWALNNSGIPRGFVSVFGQDQLGKSSLVQNWLSSFMEFANTPCCVLVCEGKPISREWAVRCMSPNRATAKAMAEAVLIFKVAQLDEMYEQFVDWVDKLRNRASEHYVPMTVPIVVVIDPVGKLATKAEASGIYAYAGMEQLDEVEMADRGHNWDRAKWTQEFVRKVGALGLRSNLTVIVVEHQNDQATGDGKKKGGPSFLPDWANKLSHRTKSGGQGLNQVACLQIALAEVGNIYSCGESVGRKIIGRAYKNSYGGVETRKFCFSLKGAPYKDTEDTLDLGLRWDYTRIEWLVQQGLLGVRQTGSSRPAYRYSSADLGFTGLSLVDAAAVVQSLPLSVFEALGAKLMIPGFVDLYAQIMGALEKDGTTDTNPPPAKAPPEPAVATPKF